jgi:hypothetical protein
MNVKNLFTLGVLVNLFYGLWFFLAPQGAADVYGYGAVATPLSNMILQFLGITFIATAAMCLAARTAEKSPGRTAVLSFIAVCQLLFLYMDIRTLMAGEEGSMNYLDLAVNVVFGFGALYFIMQDRKTA